MAARWSPAPTMVSELRGHRQPIAKFRALTLAACPRARNATALNDQRNRPVFISSLTYTRARGGRRPLWLMAARWSPAPTMVSELRGHRQPIAKFRALTLVACPRARNATALNDQRNRPVFISSLTYTRARGARRRALADGRTMVAGADDGERATGSSPTDRQIPRTDTGRLQ